MSSFIASEWKNDERIDFYEEISFAFSLLLRAGEVHHIPRLIRVNGLNKVNQAREIFRELPIKNECCVALWSQTPFDSFDSGMHRGHLRRIAEESGFFEIVDPRPSIQLDLSLPFCVMETLFIGCNSLTFHRIQSLDNVVAALRFIEEKNRLEQLENSSSISKRRKTGLRLLEFILKIYRRSPKLRKLLRKITSKSMKSLFRKAIARAYR